MNREAILEAKRLSKTFRIPEKRTVFSDVDFTAYRGESIAIVGRSGEGKTTLLHILGTLELPSEGNLSLLGKKATGWHRNRLRNLHIGFVFQSYHLLGDETALENVLMPAKVGRYPRGRKSTIKAHASALLERVGMGEFTHYLTRRLSGGQKQRVAIARALCNEPDLILADEPTGNLDIDTATQIHDLLLSLPKEGKQTLIIATHDLQLAKQCDRAFRLERGSLHPLSP